MPQAIDPSTVPRSAFTLAQQFQLTMLTKTPAQVVYQLAVKTLDGVLVSQWSQRSLFGLTLAGAGMTFAQKPLLRSDAHRLKPGLPCKNVGRVQEAVWRLVKPELDVLAQATLTTGAPLYLRFPLDVAISLLGEFAVTASTEGTLQES
jgi:hypothetical protein